MKLARWGAYDATSCFALAGVRITRAHYRYAAFIEETRDQSGAPDSYIALERFAETYTNERAKGGDVRRWTT